MPPGLFRGQCLMSQRARGWFSSFMSTNGQARVASSAEAQGWLQGPGIRATDPRRRRGSPLDSCVLCSASQIPHTSAAIYQAEMRHEGEVPEGTCIFQRGKKRPNYIFKRHRHAKEYQPCLRPGAEMPRTRLWKINTTELSTTAPRLFFWGSRKLGR